MLVQNELPRLEMFDKWNTPDKAEEELSSPAFDRP
jgi:hypothetical protein